MSREPRTANPYMEQPLFFNAAGRELFGVYHPPADGMEPHAALVFVHALLEEKKSAHRILVETARDLSAAGVAVLRFDLAGCGDSAGDLAEQSLAGWREQVVAARQWLSERVPGVPVGLMGIRFGAAVAIRVVESDPSVPWLILWEPVTEGATWLRDRVRQRLAREMLASGRGRNVAAQPVDDDATLDVDGFRLTPALVQDVEAVSLRTSSPSGFPGKVLIVQIGPASQPAPSMTALRDQLQTGGATVDLNVLRAPPFWNRLEPQPCPEAAALTLDWLGKGRRDAVPEENTAIAAADVAGLALEKPLSIPTPSGKSLTGIYHQAATNASGTELPAVLMLHGWGAYRIGPHRMFVHAARRWAAAGLPVLRFDFAGRGDSQGQTTDTTIDAMIEDGMAAWKSWRALEPNRPGVLLGMCSGAKVAAAVAARHDNELGGVVFWSPEPPDAATQAAGGVRAVRRRHDVVRAYARKMLDPSIWRKFIAGAVNWRLVYRALLGKRGAAPSERDRDLALYREFAGVRIPRLLVYGSADPVAAAACRAHREMAGSVGAPYDEHGIENADHNFYHADWERQVIDITEQWLLSRTSTGNRPSAVESTFDSGCPGTRDSKCPN